MQVSARVWDRLRQDDHSPTRTRLTKSSRVNFWTVTQMPANKRSPQTISRRSVLKASGATAVGLTAFSGFAGASAPQEIRFCGCSQVCVGFDGEESYRIFYATETDDGYTCSLRPATNEAEPREPKCFTAGEGEKIIGVLDGIRNVYPNPNNCAQRALADVTFDDCTGCLDDNCSKVVVTYEQTGRHEYEASNGVVVRTRMCKPPWKWEDDPNGPPEGGDDSAGSGPAGPPGGNGPPRGVGHSGRSPRGLFANR